MLPPSKQSSSRVGAQFQVSNLPMPKPRQAPPQKNIPPPSSGNPSTTEEQVSNLSAAAAEDAPVVDETPKKRPRLN